jgi:FixJ family two-component response regulator
MTNNPTIFVVDDDQAARESVMAMVKVKGYLVQGFASAEEFLANFKPHMAGCIVTDVRMPNMSGLDFLREIKQRGIPLPVIVITGFADVPMAVQAMKAGAMTFLDKPCQDQELISSIEQALTEGAAVQNRLRVRQELEERMATLTDDEHLVLDKLIEGTPNKRIASDLDIGLRTVELRRSNIMKKMGSNSLAELVRMTMIVRECPAPIVSPRS